MKAPKKAKLKKVAPKDAILDSKAKTNIETNPFILNPLPMRKALGKTLLHPLTILAVEKAKERKKTDSNYSVSRRVKGRVSVDPVLAFMLKSDPDFIKELVANPRPSNYEVDELETSAKEAREEVRKKAIEGYCKHVIRRGICLVGDKEFTFGKYICHVFYGYNQENINDLMEVTKVKGLNEFGIIEVIERKRINVDKDLPKDYVKFSKDELTFNLPKEIVAKLKAKGLRAKLTRLEYSTPYNSLLPFKKTLANQRHATHAITIEESEIKNGKPLSKDS